MPKKKKGQTSPKRKIVMALPKAPELTVPSATAMVIAEIDRKIAVEEAKMKVHEMAIANLRHARATVAEIPTVQKRHPAAQSQKEKAEDKHLDMTARELARAQGVLPPGTDPGTAQPPPIETEKPTGKDGMVTISNQGHKIIRTNFCGQGEPATTIEGALKRAYGPKWAEHDFVEMMGPGRTRPFRAAADLKDLSTSVLRRQLLTGAAVLQRTQGISPRVKELRKEIGKRMPLEKVEFIIQSWFKAPATNQIPEPDNPATWAPSGES